MTHVMESRCLLVDVSQEMGETDLGIAKTALLSIAQQKIIQMPTKTKMGLVMMGSTETQHGMLDENGKMLEGWDNVYAVKSIEQTDLILMEAINNLRIEEPVCSYISGLIVGLDMLINMEGGRGKQDKGLVLVTNGKSNEADQECLQGIRQQIISNGFQLTVYGINFSVNEDDCSDGEAMLRDLVRDTGGELKLVRSESEFRAVAVRSVNPVTIYRGDLEFTPHLRVKVWAYPATKVQSFPSLKKRTVGVDGDDGSSVTIERKIVLVEDRDVEVKPEDITRAFKYGRTEVPVSDEDIRVMKFEAAKTMKLIGTVKRDTIRQHYLLSTADIIVQDRDQPQPSGKMIGALAHALQNTGMVGVVSWVKRAGAPPKLYALFPHINKEQGIYGFHAVQLPFSDDLRPKRLGSLSKAGKAPSDHQLAIARRIVEDASLMDNDGNLMLAARSMALPNPVIQNFHQAIVDKALHAGAGASNSHDIVKPLRPSEELWAKVQRLASEANSMFGVVFQKEKPDNAHMNTHESQPADGEPVTKKQRTDSGVRIKSEDKDDAESLDDLDLQITNVAKAHGNSSEGTVDAIADFERAWHNDPDEAILQIKLRICAMVDKATDDRHLEKAIACFEKLRDKCDLGLSDHPEQFNRAWDELDRRYRNDAATNFWEKVQEKGLIRLKLDGDEDMASLSQPADASVHSHADEDDIGEDFD